MFEYEDRFDPGPQHPDLWAKSKAGQRKQIERFARKLQETVHEHSMTERRKYRPTEDYVERAEQWIVSEQENSTAVKSHSLEDTQREEEILEASLEERTAELRSRAAESWPTSSPERRFVYPSDFAST
ncbi:hypothetical protein P171DRAFT_491060 [Karstenula rhodostoma CBS 690.94]|uniref:Uncharacterized protein n=1 Tax=Karstenula rhodostoma CBS 690.94 TaxID=1392251 RepID=A0A9P4P8A5_9PLEO|nr:hypothetical protein P171DRAFT_491060 [Karstenula rhodostoma CBS 690.94]